MPLCHLKTPPSDDKMETNVHDNPLLVQIHGVVGDEEFLPLKLGSMDGAFPQTPSPLRFFPS